MYNEVNKIFYDEIWYNRFRKIHVYSQSRTKDYAPKVLINFKDRKVLIEHKLESLDLTRKKKLVSKLNRKLRRIENLRGKILEQENKLVVKEFYLAKLLEEEIQTQIFIVRLTSEKPEKEIFEKLKLLYSLPEEKVFKEFINEFIFFLKKLKVSKDISQEAKEIISSILNTNFFGIKYKNPKITNWSFSLIKAKKLYEILNLNSVLNLIKKSLQELGIQKIVKIRIQNRKIFSVSNFNKILNVPKNTRLTYKKTKEIIEHEIKVHLMRGINGNKFRDKNGFGYHFLELNTKEDLVIEEGLATFYEQNLFRESNKYDLSQLYIYYVRLIAVFLASKEKPFYVYKKVLKLFELQKKLFIYDEVNPTKQAKILIQRLYSDFPEIKKGYFNPRISIYLLGNRKVWEMKEKGEDIKKLLEGKKSKKVYDICLFSQDFLIFYLFTILYYLC